MFTSRILPETYLDEWPVDRLTWMHMTILHASWSEYTLNLLFLFFFFLHSWLQASSLARRNVIRQTPGNSFSRPRWWLMVLTEHRTGYDTPTFGMPVQLLKNFYACQRARGRVVHYCARVQLTTIVWHHGTWSFSPLSLKPESLYRIVSTVSLIGISRRLNTTRFATSALSLSSFQCL